MNRFKVEQNSLFVKGFKSFFQSYNQVIRSTAESFDVEIEKLYIQDIDEIAKLEKFELKHEIPNYKEFKVTYPIYKFF
jgi:glycine cleavage system pyridoxal-binding protein P